MMTTVDQENKVRIRSRRISKDENRSEDGPSSSSALQSSLQSKSQARGGQNVCAIENSQRLSIESTHLGSYAGSVDNYKGSRRSSVKNATSRNASRTRRNHFLGNVIHRLETYGIQELRDGFFDATFYRPSKTDQKAARRKASLSLKYFLPQQWTEARRFVTQILTTGSGITLGKSFLGFFLAYIICLIPVSRDWLGKYNYIIAISVILNHPGRPIGSQVDGALLTTVGTAAGLGWGSLALYVSTSTPVAQRGYGGVLASFLVLFTASIAWLRCMYIRFYQAVICAGIAICYTCLADTSQAVGWAKIFDYGIPWVLGQAIGLVVSICIFPNAGARSLV